MAQAAVAAAILLASLPIAPQPASAAGDTYSTYSFTPNYSVNGVYYSGTAAAFTSRGITPMIFSAYGGFYTATSDADGFAGWGIASGPYAAWDRFSVWSANPLTKPTYVESFDVRNIDTAAVTIKVTTSLVGGGTKVDTFAVPAQSTGTVSLTGHGPIEGMYGGPGSNLPAGTGGATTIESADGTRFTSKIRFNNFVLRTADEDTTPPVIVRPADVSANATSAAGASVTFGTSATDAVDGTVPVRYWLNYGTEGQTEITSPYTFPIGVTTVTAEATDAAENTATTSFTVTVEDTAGPAITVSDIAAEATFPTGALVTLNGSASDLTSGEVAISYYLTSPTKTRITSPRLFPFGTTYVTAEATDGDGNTTSKTFTVTVVDTSAPDAPTNPGGDPMSESTLGLYWDGVSDLSGIAHYTVYSADGTKLYQVAGQSCIAGGLEPETAYSFYVTATDYAGNESARSELFGATTTSMPTSGIVYRFYNIRTGTHFYTASAEERDAVIARWPNLYTYEGVAYGWAQTPGTVPLHRFYNPAKGAHFYTASRAEYERVRSVYAGTYTYEGVACYVLAAPVEGAMPVYRFFSPRIGAHFYTASAAESDYVKTNYKATYAEEGIGFFVMPSRPRYR